MFEDTVAAVISAILDAEARRAAERAYGRPQLDDEAPADARDPGRHPAADQEPIESSITLLISTPDLPRADLRPGRQPGQARGSRRPTSRREGPVILAANHSSNLDAVVIGSWIIPKLGRRIHWLGKKELFAWPVVGWAAANGGVHPVDRDAADVEAFRLAKRILDEGHDPVRVPGGHAQPRRHAPAGVATASPCSRCGLEHRSCPSPSPARPGVWPEGQKLPRPGGHVTVRVGRPFRLADVLPPGTDRRTAKGLATTLIMERIAALLPRLAARDLRPSPAAR